MPEVESKDGAHGTGTRRALPRLLLGVFLGLAVSAGTLLGSNAPSADASSPRSCLNNGDYGAINGHQNDQYTSTNRGTRADMRIIDPSLVNCQHVSSIYAASPSSDANVEFAYLIGYSHCSLAGPYYYSSPTLFYYAVNASGGLIGCQLFGDVVPDSSYQSFRVADTNNNGYWNLAYNGSGESVSIHNDFNNSDNVYSMERATSTDSGYARWQNLSEFHSGTWTWSDWDANHCWHVYDPTYSCNIIDHTTTSFTS